ncbi:MAG: pyruvate ferredoxin oxidoreductase, partial [Methanosphaera sp. rholeuAM6]
ALSAPINIWNDQQDSISERDSGWIQLFCETGQEAFDTILQAYKIAENPDICVPVMVCVDGFILTHTVDPVELISQEEADSFLPPFTPVNAYLRTEDPMSIGTLADTEHYLEIRYDLEKAVNASKEVITAVGKEYGEMFGRTYGLIEEYKSEDADIILIAMGSICGTIKDVVDEQREAGKKVGLVRVRSYRPFPKEALKEAVKDAKLAVLDKDISFSVGGALYADVKASVNNETYGYVLGLGGRDITPKHIEEIITKTENPTNDVEWIGLRE